MSRSFFSASFANPLRPSRLKALSCKDREAQWPLISAILDDLSSSVQTWTFNRSLT